MFMNYRHGAAAADYGKRPKEYGIWKTMRNRCNSPASQRWPAYGGRGVKVCDRWQDSFAAFIDDMGPRPSPDHSLDRIDNGGNYEPGNCRWATRSEQVLNRECVVRYEWNGRMMTPTEIAAETGIPYQVLYQRLHRYKWPDERAVTVPTREWGPGKYKPR